MSWPRIIACLDVKDGHVVKGTRFTDFVDCGDPVELAQRYADQGVDELMFLDIDASASRTRPRETRLAWVTGVARSLFIPFSVGGGVRDWEGALRLLDLGADRVSVGTAATRDTDVLGEIAGRAGRQAVILSLDVRRTARGGVITRRGGRETTEIDALSFAREGEAAGAGEILLNVIDADGTGGGFDVEFTRTVAETVSVPVIASGGAGCPEHFLAILREGKAAAALGARLFHTGRYTVADVKRYLIEHGVEVRPC